MTSWGLKVSYTLTKNRLMRSMVLAITTLAGSPILADTREQTIARILAGAAALPVEEIAMWHCYHEHRDDRLARKACEASTLDATQALIADLPELADGLIAPAFEAEKDTNPSQIGQTRFGGVPDIPAQFDWPLSERFTVKDAAETLESVPLAGPVPLSNALPLTFVAQIDLSALSPLTGLLPNDGRLLIFMDYATRFEDEANASTKIIWDKTPRAELTRAAAPSPLIWLDTLANAEWAEISERLNREFGDDLEAEPFNSGFLAPEISVRFSWGFKLLAANNIEVFSSDFNRRSEATGAADIYAEIEESWPGDDEDDTPPYHQILGAPFPEQDDPRFDAYFQHIFNSPDFTREDIAKQRATLGLSGKALETYEQEKALEFKLLLQLDVASFLDMNSEGHFYFFLHKHDLAARNFDAVIVIYQQT